jgi:inosose dehydratase
MLFPQGFEAVKQVIPLLAKVGASMLVLSASSTPERREIAGRVTEADGLSQEQWHEAGDFLRDLAGLAHEAGLDATFHHHAGTYVETPSEIRRLFEWVNPDVMGLCLDTGHLVFGGGDNSVIIAEYGPHIRHVHLKNVDAEVLRRVRANQLGYVEAIKLGVFCPLESGSIDIAATVQDLVGMGYDGWLVVEQDIDLSVPGYTAPFEGAAHARLFLKEAVGV